ncbi:hypothetical protein HGRIS_002576 [Hohenbuehelia grisea]|uniref:EXS domain-containing protein n=1 Tax=Hohenbuehelia grisea TaxID=104357 RepID=A0ABR3JM19_9AGAR
MDDAEDLGTVPNAAFPLPFRVLLLAGLGILGWATNLHGLDIMGVDVVGAMDLRTLDIHQAIALPSRPATSRGGAENLKALYRTMYLLCITYSVWWIAAWALFWSATYADPDMVDVFGYIPAVAALVVILILICPFDLFWRAERDKFLLALRRCLLPHREGAVYFSDVVFADIFTSFAKVLGDVWLSLCMLLPGNSLLVPPDLEGLIRWVLPCVMSIPYAVRFRQCIIEYASPHNESRRPLYNAIKYATSFPVIFLSAAQRHVVFDDVETTQAHLHDSWEGESGLFRLWLLAAAINSLYSFWWDVTNDWGLDLLKPRGMSSQDDRPGPPKQLVLPSMVNSPLTSSLPSPTREGALNTHYASVRDQLPYPYGLRPRLLYPILIYPSLIFFNLVLRLTWSLKLSSHLHSATDGSMVIFWLEVAEILRRWMWVFVRVEWEVIKRAQEGVRKGGYFGHHDESEYELIPTPAGEVHEFP